MRWVEKGWDSRKNTIPTESSRPHHHPREIAPEIVQAIVEERLKHNRCSEVIQEELRLKGIVVSLNAVKRTLKRRGLLRERSPWKKIHQSVERPDVACPGDLVELDTIHIVPLQSKRFYIYTLLDVHSRWAYAEVSRHINTHFSLAFLDNAQATAPFEFSMLQSDHGPEFSKYFSQKAGISHRHSRVRKPNDNGHLERFNRTIQEECLLDLPEEPEVYQSAISLYLPYYNDERLHLGLHLKTPLEVVRSY